MVKRKSKMEIFNETKQNIINEIERSKIENILGLLHEVAKHFIHSNKSGIKNTICDKTHTGFCLTIIVFEITVFAILLSFFPPFWKAGELLNIEILFAILAFVIALAAYVASVARQIVEKLPKAKKKYPKKWLVLKCNIFFLVSAEILMLLFGLAAIIRIFTGPYQMDLHYRDLCLSFDSFLLTYLAFILAYMAYLHYRIWRQIKPWSLNPLD